MSSYPRPRFQFRPPAFAFRLEKLGLTFPIHRECQAQLLIPCEVTASIAAVELIATTRNVARPAEPLQSIGPCHFCFERWGLNQVGGLAVATVSHRRKRPTCLKAPIRKPFAYLPPGVAARDVLPVKPIHRNAIFERSSLSGPTALLAIIHINQNKRMKARTFLGALRRAQNTPPAGGAPFRLRWVPHSCDFGKGGAPGNSDLTEKPSQTAIQESRIGGEGFSQQGPKAAHVPKACMRHPRR